MTNADHEAYRQLTIRYLAGEASPEEAMRMHEWLKDPASRSEYEAIRQAWNLAGGDPVPAGPAADDHWGDLQARLPAAGKAVVRPVAWWRYAAVAAVTVGIIVSGFLLFNRKPAAGSKDGSAAIAIVTTEKATDSIRNVVLRDSSVIALNKNSELRYDGAFNKAERAVQLKGEAFFDIAPNRLKPFIITVGDLSIKVVGTSFNVRTGAEGNSTEVQVKSGVVKMSCGQQEITVTRDQTGLFFTGSRKLLVKSGIDLNALSYATRSFRFNDLPLAEVCRYLEKSFAVRIDLDKEKFNDCRITAQFDHKPLDYILDVVTATVDARYTMINEQVYIEGNGCK